MAIRILVSNKSTVVLPWTMSELRGALTAQAKDLRASPWGIDAQVLASRTGRVDGELVLVDDSDQAGALGYHETVNGVPGGIVAMRTTMNAGYDPCVTASHEFLEMAGDIDASALAEVETSGSFKGAAYELCDPVEADGDGYVVLVKGKAMRVSNFVLPAWFLPGAPGPFDWRSQLKAPLTLRPGGYMAKFDPQHGWTQAFARDEATGGMSFRALHSTRIPRRWARARDRAARAELVEPSIVIEEVRAGEPVL